MMVVIGLARSVAGHARIPAQYIPGNIKPAAGLQPAAGGPAFTRLPLGGAVNQTAARGCSLSGAAAAFLIPGVLLALSLSGLGASAEGRTARARVSGSSVPNLNIESACQTLGHYDPANPGNYDNCVKQERDARGEIEKSWRSVPAGRREQCLHLVTPPALPSYISLQGCLNTAQGAEELAKKDRASPGGEYLPSGGGETRPRRAVRAWRRPNGGEIAKP
jgi:hypothetical protein